MLLRSSELDAYSAELNAVCDEAARVAMEAYDAMRAADPGASVAAVREGTIGIVGSVVGS